MSRFQVDPEQLGNLAGQLDRLRGDLEREHHAETVSADLGAPRIHAYLEAFESAWSDGMAIIRNQLEECAQRLRDAAAEYGSADSCVQTAVTPGGGAPR